jgi:hypothetical protein
LCGGFQNVIFSRNTLAQEKKMGKHDNALIIWFEDIGIEDVPLVGGKNASLGEMYQKLTSKGVAIPHGFAITAYAYQYLLKEAGIEDAIKDALAGLDTHDLHNLQARGEKVRNIIRNAEFPDDLRQAIIESYKKMEAEYGSDVPAKNVLPVFSPIAPSPTGTTRVLDSLTYTSPLLSKKWPVQTRPLLVLFSQLTRKAALRMRYF